MPQRLVTYQGKSVVLACDGNCSKAFGVNGRPKRDLSDQPDDYVPDSEVGTAPPPGSTLILGEGGEMKPHAVRLDVHQSEQMNKWCARECERSVMVTPGEPVVLPDMEHPEPNIAGRCMAAVAADALPVDLGGDSQKVARPASPPSERSLDDLIRLVDVQDSCAVTLAASDAQTICLHLEVLRTMLPDSDKPSDLRCAACRSGNCPGCSGWCRCACEGDAEPPCPVPEAT